MLSHWNHLHQLLSDLDLYRAPRPWPDKDLNEHSAKRDSLWAAADLVEDKDALVLTIDLPGLSSEDVNVNIEDQLLTISAERKRPDYGEGTLRRSERHFGHFQRTYRLDPKLDAAQSRAEVIHGVLRVEIPKSAESQPIEIEVR